MPSALQKVRDAARHMTLRRPLMGLCLSEPSGAGRSVAVPAALCRDRRMEYRREFPNNLADHRLDPDRAADEMSDRASTRPTIPTVGILAIATMSWKPSPEAAGGPPGPMPMWRLDGRHDVLRRTARDRATRSIVRAGSIAQAPSWWTRSPPGHRGPRREEASMRPMEIPGRPRVAFDDRSANAQRTTGWERYSRSLLSALDGRVEPGWPRRPCGGAETDWVTPPGARSRRRGLCTIPCTCRPSRRPLCCGDRSSGQCTT